MNHNKKTITGIFAAVLLLSLAACANPTDSADEKKDSDPAVTVPDQKQDASIEGTYDAWTCSVTTGWVKLDNQRLVISPENLSMSGTTVFPASGFTSQKLGYSDQQIWIMGASGSVKNTVYCYDYVSQNSDEFGVPILWIKAEATVQKTLYMPPALKNIATGSTLCFIPAGKTPVMTPSFSTSATLTGDIAKLLANGSTIFALKTQPMSLSKSEDKGQTWTSVDISALTNNGNNATSLFLKSSATMMVLSDSNIIGYSTDSGNTWKLTETNVVTAASGMCIQDIAVCGSAIIATVQKRNETTGLPDFLCWRSEDMGTTWAKIETSAGLTVSMVWALASSGTKAYAGGNTGLYVSSDAGKTWASLKTPVWSPEECAKLGYGISSLDANPNLCVTKNIAASGDILIGEFSNDVSSSGEMYMSKDGGATWTWIHAGQTNASPSGDCLFITGSGDSGFWMTKDGGKSWYLKTAMNGLASEYVNDVIVIDGTILAGTRSGLSISK